MTDPYPNNSANTFYDHLLSLSNTISDSGESIASFQSSTIASGTTDPTMPSFTRPGSIRRRFLRIISFGHYSSGSEDDLEQPLTRTQDFSRRYSAPADVQSTNRPTYTAHQSLQSSDSAQTTIIHEVIPGAAPFSINAFRDQRHDDYYISDTEFDTPPSLEVVQQSIHPAEVTRRLTPAPVIAEDIIQHPTRLRRDKSFMQCNVCNRILEYTQFHCPGCAARTLHHVPGSVQDSYTENDVRSRTLQPRKGRQNQQQHDIPTEESSWDTQGLEAGTTEESWTTTANDAVDASPERVQESSLQYGVDEEREQGEIPHQTCHRCRDTRLAIVHHCCCASRTHATCDTSCTQHWYLRGCSVIAAVVCDGPTHGDHACKGWKRGVLHHHIYCKLSGAEYVKALDAASQGCVYCEGRRGEAAEQKTAWWVRWGKWFCCC